jgi:hypothetical protein
MGSVYPVLLISPVPRQEQGSGTSRWNSAVEQLGHITSDTRTSEQFGQTMSKTRPSEQFGQTMPENWHAEQLAHPTSASRPCQKCGQIISVTGHSWHIGHTIAATGTSSGQLGHILGSPLQQTPEPMKREVDAPSRYLVR